jgi:hypothetical protein
VDAGRPQQLGLMTVAPGVGSPDRRPERTAELGKGALVQGGA